MAENRNSNSTRFYDELTKLKLKLKVETGGYTQVFGEYEFLLKGILSTDDTSLFNKDNYIQSETEEFVYTNFRFISGKLMDFWRKNLSEESTKKFRSIIDLLKHKHSFLYYLKDKERFTLNQIYEGIIKETNNFEKMKVVNQRKKEEEARLFNNNHLLNDYSDSRSSPMKVADSDLQPLITSAPSFIESDTGFGEANFSFESASEGLRTENKEVNIEMSP